jgi:hypothetical protein
MREIGRKCGKIGGKRSLESMTLEERSARAKKAATAAAKKRTARTAWNASDMQSASERSLMFGCIVRGYPRAFAYCAPVA